MAKEEVTDLKLPPLIEISCKSSGKVRRFSVGTKAGFALQLINRKLGSEIPHASYIEAVKEGEDPVWFGPSSVLVNYGNGWKLQTVAEEGFEEVKGVEPKKIPKVESPKGLHPESRNTPEPKSSISNLYIGRILLALILIFLIGGVFTLALENLPRLLLFISSSM